MAPHVSKAKVKAAKAAVDGEGHREAELSLDKRDAYVQRRCQHKTPSKARPWPQNRASCETGAAACR